MPWKPQSYLSPKEFDQRVREPHRNKVWTVSVMVVTELAYVAFAGLTGFGAVAGGLAIAIASFLGAGWVEQRWRGFHTVPLQMLDEQVVELRRELASGETESAERRRKQTLADTLTDMKEDAVSRILNKGFLRGVQSPNDFEEACKAADDWLRDVIDVMEKAGCSKQDIHLVRTLKTYKRERFTAVRKIDDKASWFNTHLDRVQEIIKKYAQD